MDRCKVGSVTKTFTLALLVPLLGSACGSTPAGPSEPAAQAPVAVGLSLSILSMGDSSQGMGSPTTVTVGARAVGEISAGTIEAVAYRMSDAAGATLAEASLASRLPIPAGSSPEARVSQTLSWNTEKGYGKRIDVTLTVRDSSGMVRTISYWAPR